MKVRRTPVLRDFEKYKAWHREATGRLQEALDLTDEQVPYVEPVYCRHFEGGTADCPYSCLWVFGDTFLTVEP